MARTESEHVVFMIVEYSPPVENVENVENGPETPCECGPDCRTAYVPVMAVTGKASGLDWIKNHGNENCEYRVGTFSTGAFKLGKIEKVVVKRSLIAQ